MFLHHSGREGDLIWQKKTVLLVNSMDAVPTLQKKPLDQEETVEVLHFHQHNMPSGV